MKNGFLTLLLSLIFITGFCQSYKFEFPGRLNPTIKKENLHQAVSINDVMPEFNSHFGIPYQERLLLRQLLDQQNMFHLGFLTDHHRRTENYSKILDFVSVEITTLHDGNSLSAQSTDEQLTMEQKDILNRADLGTDITVKIKFRFKNALSDHNAIGSKLVEGRYVVTLVPATEAEYPGGYSRIAEYLSESVINKLSEATTVEKIRQAIVHFTINEEGEIVNAKISRTSSDPNIDKLILEATVKMPKWKPAENTQGIKVKQEFNIPFGNSGC